MNFRQKGFNYERKLAKTLGEWWCGDAKSLWRNANSGARATVVGQVYGGDIIPANASCGVWPLCIEIKKAEGWSIDGFLNENPGEPLLAFMLQCLSASQLGCNKIPILICAKKYKKPLVFLYKRTAPKKRVEYLARLVWREEVTKKLQKQYPWGGTIDFMCLHLDIFLRSFYREDFLS